MRCDFALLGHCQPLRLCMVLIHWGKSLPATSNLSNSIHGHAWPHPIFYGVQFSDSPSPGPLLEVQFLAPQIMICQGEQPLPASANLLCVTVHSLPHPTPPGSFWPGAIPYHLQPCQMQ